MEILSGRKIREIFLDNDNWYNFYNEHKPLIRDAIVENVVKIISCCTDALGFHLMECPKCGNQRKIPHSCKSKLCSSCGKKASDQWIKTNLEELPESTWQHITFTLPQEFRDFFWCNREILFDAIFPIPAQIITEYALKKFIIPGIFVALHTFGRNMKKNVHFHLSVTLGGLSICLSEWISDLYIHHVPIKAWWKARVCSVFRNLYKSGNLILPPGLRHLKKYASFNSWLDTIYKKDWVVHLSKPSSDHKRNVEYLGRYIQRPPIGETRICDYDGETVEFDFLDHHTGDYQKEKLPVMEFIKRLICHIHDKHFKVIRYYNWLSNRSRGKLLPVVRRLLGIEYGKNLIFKVTWRQMILKIYKEDPVICKSCNCEMILVGYEFPPSINILAATHNMVAELKANV